jgi:hypothetical protein
VNVKNQFISYSFITNINTREVNKMADIKISNLSGSDLFNDSESFMVEIVDDTEFILGGRLNSACVPGGTNINCGNQPSVVIIQAPTPKLTIATTL